MTALGSAVAFDPRLNPHALYEAARLVQNEEDADTLDAFAATLADILALPTTGWRP